MLMHVIAAEVAEIIAPANGPQLRASWHHRRFQVIGRDEQMIWRKVTNPARGPKRQRSGAANEQVSIVLRTASRASAARGDRVGLISLDKDPSQFNSSQFEA